MSTNRVGGPSSPEPSKGLDQKSVNQNRRVEKVEKVKEVDETENEQKTKQKFQQYMQDDADDDSAQAKAPTPFETQFYTPPQTPAPVPNPSYSPAPSVEVSPVVEEPPQPLPKSATFWSEIDSPPDLPPEPPRYIETSASSARQDNFQNAKEQKGGRQGGAKKKRGEWVVSVKKEEGEELGGKSSHAALKKSDKTASTKKRGPREDDAPENATLPKEEPFSIEARGHAADAAKKKKAARIANAPASEDRTQLPPSTIRRLDKEQPRDDARFPSALSWHEEKQARESGAEDKRERGKGGGKKELYRIESPGIPPVAPEFIPGAETAAMQSSSYLNPQIVPLFFQMVGAIYMMTAPGGDISRTEIRLTAPSFANSKFFGSTITIEKYATAPDSLNIRLTGSNEAVTAFNQNIQSLYTAFQQGNFNFRIGRIDVSYSREKPLFKRKSASAEAGDLGEDSEDRRRE